MEQILEKYQNDGKSLQSSINGKEEKKCYQSIIEDNENHQWLTDPNKKNAFPQPLENLLALNTGDFDHLMTSEIYCPKHKMRIDDRSILNTKIHCLKIVGMDTEIFDAKDSLPKETFVEENDMEILLKLTVIKLLKPFRDQFYFMDYITNQSYLCNDNYCSKDNTEEQMKQSEKIFREGYCNKDCGCGTGEYENLGRLSNEECFNILNFSEGPINHSTVYRELLKNDTEFRKKEEKRLIAWTVLQTRFPLQLSLVSRLIIYHDLFDQFPFVIAKTPSEIQKTKTFRQLSVDERKTFTRIYIKKIFYTFNPYRRLDFFVMKNNDDMFLQDQHFLLENQNLFSVC